MKTNKTTFDLTDWCDYARGLAAPDAVQAMDELLERSAGARKTVELFRRVSAVAQSDQANEVPSYALRVAKAAAALRSHAPRRSGASSALNFLPFSVTYDSLLQAAPAGTRDLSSSHQRIASFEARDFVVHVRLEQETNPHSQVVVGQLLRHDPEPRPVPEIPVLVLSDKRVVGRSLTSRFGEFQADGLPPDPLDLCLLVGPEDCIDIPLGAFPQDA
jgi:hypothetical protein